MTTNKKVVILGSGPVGSKTAIYLLDKAEVYLVAPLPIIFPTGNYSHAYATLPAFLKEHTLLWDGCKSFTNKINLVHGKAVATDLTKKKVTIEKSDGQTEDMEYDVLIVSTGLSDGYRKPSQVMSPAEWMAKLEQEKAKMIEAKILAFIGGGSTAVSLAIGISQLRGNEPGTECHLFCPNFLKYLSPTLQKIARDRLEENGIILHENVRVKKGNNSKGDVISAEDGKVLLKNADLIVWATGGHANTDFLPKSLLESDGRVRTDEYFQVPGYAGLFAAGDVSSTPGIDVHTAFPMSSSGTLVSNVTEYLKSLEADNADLNLSLSKASEIRPRAMALITKTGDGFVGVNGITWPVPLSLFYPYVWWIYGGRTTVQWESALKPPATTL